jgi:ketosteroid isomerase-like protein
MRKILTSAVLILSASFAVAAEDRSSALRAELNAFNDQFNTYAATLNVDGMMSLYDKDVIWIAPTEAPARGREGVPRQTFTFVADNKGTLAHTVTDLIISDDGSQAVMIGTNNGEIKSKDFVVRGTYLFVLKKKAGQWHIVSDMFNKHDVK